MFLRSSALLLILTSAAAAQGSAARTLLQNTDISILFGLTTVGSHEIGGTGVTVRGATSRSATNFGYGYQLLRFSGSSLWLQFSNTTGGQSLGAGAAGSIDGGWNALTLGARLDVPVTSRVSLLAGLGAGGGDFHSPVINNGAASSYATWHGVMEASGAVDIRVLRHFSIRLQAADVISGHELSGSASPNHFVAAGGIVFHQ